MEVPVAELKVQCLRRIEAVRSRKCEIVITDRGRRRTFTGGWRSRRMHRNNHCLRAATRPPSAAAAQ